MPIIETRALNLTPNFLLGEFVRTQDAMPDRWIINNLYRVANRLQAVRDLLGRPIIISSGYRTLAHNKEVGGAENSLHINGMAADISVPGMTPKQLHDYLKNWNGGLGLYKYHVHVDIGSKRRWVDL